MMRNAASSTSPSSSIARLLVTMAVAKLALHVPVATSVPANYYVVWSCNGNVNSCPLTSSAWTNFLYSQSVDTCSSTNTMYTCSSTAGVVELSYAGETCSATASSSTTVFTADQMAVGGVYSSSSNTTKCVGDDGLTDEGPHSSLVFGFSFLVLFDVVVVIVVVVGVVVVVVGLAA